VIGVGIYDGDIVMVDATKDPKVGDIVVVLVDCELTLKFLQKEDGKFCLQPENAKYQTIYPKSDLKIEGVVTNVMRKYT
jgi:DNA polymerase V